MVCGDDERGTWYSRHDNRGHGSGAEASTESVGDGTASLRALDGCFETPRSQSAV